MTPVGSDRRPAPSSTSLAWTIAGIATFWSYGYAVVRASDLWWHLAAGRWMLEHRAWPSHDPFSFTAVDQPWMNHEWLADLMFALWERGFGLTSLVYWKWGVVVITFLILQRTLTRLSGDPLSSFVATVVAAAVAEPLLDLRPHLYSLLAFVMLLHATVASERPARLRLVVLFLVWANLHAGVVFGLLALAAIRLPALVADASPGRREAATILAACAVATLVNPNGTGPFAYALRYALDSTSPYQGLVEWQSPLSRFAIPTPLYPYAVGLFAGVALYAVLDPRSRRRWAGSWGLLVLAVLTLAMSLRSARFVPLAAIATSVVVAPALASVLAPIAARLPTMLPPLAAATGFGALLLTRYPLGPTAFDELTVTPSFPVDTASFLVANELGGRAFTYYAWGGYVSLRTAGRTKVFIDGRADSVYGDQVYTDYEAVLLRAPGWQEVVERSGANLFLWPRALPRHWEPMVASARWRLLHADLVSVLLARADTMPPHALRPPPDSAYRRLAIGWEALTNGDAARAAIEFRQAQAAAPHLSLVCYLLAVATARDADDSLTRRDDEGRSHGGDTGNAFPGSRCRKIFPYQNSVADRLALRPLPPAAASPTPAPVVPGAT